MQDQENNTMGSIEEGNAPSQEASPVETPAPETPIAAAEPIVEAVESAAETVVETAVETAPVVEAIPEPAPVEAIQDASPAVEEAEDEFEDEDKEEAPDLEMTEMYNSSFDMPMENSIIEGIILKITNEDVMVAIGGKSEAVISLSEFKDEDPANPLAVGKKYQLVYKGSRSGRPNLSRIEARRILGEVKLEEAFKNQTPVDVRAVRRTKGGLRVEVDGISGFMPFSHSGVRRGQEAELEGLLGQVFPALIAEQPKEKDGWVFSRRLFLDQKAQALREEALKSVEVGKLAIGKVKHLTQFGAFVDINGIDGLLHVKDMAWGHVEKPEDVVRIGQEIEVLVLSIEGEKVALGLKQKSSDPWENFEETHPVGSKCPGKVTSLTQYGVFVEIEPGIEGLVHISELSWTKRVRHPNEVLKENDEVMVAILGIDKAKKRVSLGYKQAVDDPWERITREHPEGSNVTGTVVSMTSYGAFINLGDGVDGMVHVSDLSYGQKIKHPSEALKEGDVVEARVLKIDRANRKISLGLKQAKPDPWFTAEKRYHEGDVVEAKVNRLAPFGAFAEVEPGLDGLIHVSEVSVNKVNHPQDALKIGQTIKAKITRLVVDQRKLGLSIRLYEEEGDTRPAPRAQQNETPMLSDFGQILSSALEESERKSQG